MKRKEFLFSLLLYITSIVINPFSIFVTKRKISIQKYFYMSKNVPTCSFIFLLLCKSLIDYEQQKLKIIIPKKETYSLFE